MWNHLRTHHERDHKCWTVSCRRCTVLCSSQCQLWTLLCLSHRNVETLAVMPNWCGSHRCVDGQWKASLGLSKRPYTWAIFSTSAFRRPGAVFGEGGKDKIKLFFSWTLMVALTTCAPGPLMCVSATWFAYAGDGPWRNPPERNMSVLNMAPQSRV